MNFKKLLLISLLLMLSTTVFSATYSFAEGTFMANNKEDSITILITINNTSYTKMADVPKTGFLEVYSILGQRVSRVDLKNSEGGISIDLPKGLYILKAGKVAQKVIVK